MIPIEFALRHPFGKPVLVSGVAAGNAIVKVVPDVLNAQDASVYSTTYRITLKAGVAPVTVGTVLEVEGIRYIVSMPPVMHPGGALVCRCVETT